MKYILTFEQAAKYGRPVKYTTLSKEQEDEIEVVIRQFIDSQDIFGRIEKLEYDDFYLANFNYKQFFNDFITSKIYQPKGNVYFAVDKYLKDKKESLPTPALRNSMHSIINKIYTEFLTKTDWKNRIDRRLIEEIEKNPGQYEEILKEFKDKINPDVKDACDWILNSLKFNL